MQRPPQKMDVATALATGVVNPQGQGKPGVWTENHRWFRRDALFRNPVIQTASALNLEGPPCSCICLADALVVPRDAGHLHLVE